MTDHVTGKAQISLGRVAIAAVATVGAAAHDASVEVTHSYGLCWKKLHGEWLAEALDATGRVVASGVGDRESALLELADFLMPPEEPKGADE
jgi:hypothetical protein